MTLRELFFSLGYKVDGSSEKKAEQSIKSLKSMATKALGAIGIGFSVAGLANLAQAAADMNATASQFQQVFDGLEKDANDSLNGVADYAGTVSNRMKGSFTQIAAFAKTTGMETSDALSMTERAMKAVADSSAFYDRTLEQTTQSLQSFLKGNYENDAALGLSCTEVTRNTAAMKLYGKSFKDLSEQQKQLTLLKMVEDANAMSGALGQAARESDTWTNQLGNMKQGITDLKAAAGNTFLKPAIGVLKIMTGLLQKATAKINSMSGTIEEKTNVITRNLKNVWGFLSKVGAMANKVAKFFGGWGNVLKLLTVGVGAFMVAMKWKKIIDGINMVKAAFKPMNLKLLAIAAVAMLLFAIIDDFIAFMKGNDSVIGTLFEKAGIDSDKARETIANAMNKVKEVVKNVFGSIRDFITEHKGQILSILGVIAKVVGVIIGVIAVVKTVIAIFTVVKAVLAAVGAVIAFLTSPIGLVVAAIAALIAIGVALYKNWDKIKAKASAIFQKIVDTISEKIEAIKTFFTELPGKAKQWMHDFVTGLIDGIKEKISGFVDTIKGIGEEIASFLHFSVPDKGPLTDYESWMPDFMQGMAKGIKGNMPLIKKAVQDASDVLSNMGGVSLNGKTALNAIGGNTKTNNVNQVNEYNINVSGTDPQTVNNAANTIKGAGSDNTNRLADALAYGL